MRNPIVIILLRSVWGTQPLNSILHAVDNDTVPSEALSKPAAETVLFSGQWKRFIVYCRFVLTLPSNIYPRLSSRAWMIELIAVLLGAMK